jgi:hypothetical protein
MQLNGRTPMPKTLNFSSIHRPHDGMLIKIRKNLAFADVNFTDIIDKISVKNYEVGTEECRYDTVTDSITISGFGRLPSFMFVRIVRASDFRIGQLVELGDTGQRLYITDLDTERDQAELSFISPSDGLMNLLTSDNTFEHKTVAGTFQVSLLQEVEGDYSANKL